MDFQAYLQSESLFTDTPYEQADLRPRERVVAFAEEVIFENFYRSRKEKIYCHICGGHRHLNGITGLLGGSSRILFGSSCAKDFFGPEITRLCKSDLKRRTKRAYDRYLILDIANSIEPIENWLKSYRHLISHAESAWAEIYLKHEKAIPGLLEHLRRNGGRLVETTHMSIGGNAKDLEHIEQHTIVTHIAGDDAIPYLKQSTQRLILVDSFVHAVRNVKTDPNEQMFSNLAAMHRKTLDAAQVIDSCITFTHDFFSPEKLEALTSWMEKRRRNRLSHMPEVTRQNLEPQLRKIMGSGIERPSQSLCDAIRAAEVSDKLLYRSQRKELKEISVG